jgi:hypothetical protein
MAATPISSRQRVLNRRTSLWTLRSMRDVEYKEVTQFLIPRLGKFYRPSDDRSQRYSQYKSILDSTGTKAHRIASAGLMAGMTSPARPWFRVKTSDNALAEFDPVKDWLGKLTTMMQDVYASSNTYRSLHSIYEELVAFGTGCSLMVPDYKDIIRHHVMTVGEYAIATDNRGVASTVVRDYEMTVEEMAEEFGLDKLSMGARNAYDRGNYDQRFTITHLIEPRKNRDLTKRDAKNKRFQSIYVEAGSASTAYDNQGSPDGLLRESGFDRFPALAPRWSTASNEVYGWGPAMEAIGDIKQLQHEQLRKGQAIDYQTDPPLQVPTSLKGRAMDRLPGGITYIDDVGGNQSRGIRSMFEVKLELNALLADIQDVRERINSAMFVDLFMMISNDERSDITAREIAERHEEKLLMLGPVLERLHDELLSPMIDITFDQIVAAGALPPPPKELQGHDLNIEFVSTLAQAQRAVGITSVDRLIGMVGSVAQMKPEVLDKIDADQMVDRYADMLGVDPSIIVADEKVAIVRQQRAKQQAQMQAAAMVPTAAGAAKDMSQTNTDGKNALTDVMSMFSGYNNASGGAGQ